MITQYDMTESREPVLEVLKWMMAQMEKDNSNTIQLTMNKFTLDIIFKEMVLAQNVNAITDLERRVRNLELLS